MPGCPAIFGERHSGTDDERHDCMSEAVKPVVASHTRGRFGDLDEGAAQPTDVGAACHPPRGTTGSERRGRQDVPGVIKDDGHHFWAECDRPLRRGCLGLAEGRLAVSVDPDECLRDRHGAVLCVGVVHRECQRLRAVKFGCGDGQHQRTPGRRGDRASDSTEMGTETDARYRLILARPGLLDSRSESGRGEAPSQRGDLPLETPAGYGCGRRDSNPHGLSPTRT